MKNSLNSNLYADVVKCAIFVHKATFLFICVFVSIYFHMQLFHVCFFFNFLFFRFRLALALKFHNLKFYARLLGKH